MTKTSHSFSCEPEIMDSFKFECAQRNINASLQIRTFIIGYLKEIGIKITEKKISRKREEIKLE